MKFSYRKMVTAPLGIALVCFVIGVVLSGTIVYQYATSSLYASKCVAPTE